MNIFRYWAWVTAEETGPDGQPYDITIKRGSDLSQEDAHQRAEQASDELRARIRGGGEPPSWYEYSTRQLPEPILEEIADESGERAAAITINRFGCEVLNTQHLAFLDIDLKPSRSSRGGGLLGRLFGGGKQRDTEEDPMDVAVRGAISQLRDWVARQSGASVRVYRTSAGLRYLFVAPAMDPTQALHEPAYEELGCDPLYRRLCVAQNCFRARLTPKPWRLSMSSPRPWRVDLLESDPTYYNGWHKTYLAKAGNYAACAFLEIVGDAAPPDKTAGRLIEIHDERAGAHSGLPLA